MTLLKKVPPRMNLARENLLTTKRWKTMKSPGSGFDDVDEEEDAQGQDTMSNS